jgi:ribosomal protein S18 acetylase RimI-like enzyme
MPEPFLRSLSVEQRERVWRQILERHESDTCVADDAGEILGWANFGRSRDADAGATTGELWAIYVHPMHWRRGVGSRLLNDAEAHLTRGGFSEVTLWVLERNTQAVAFYAFYGFAVEPGTEKSIEAGGRELNEIRLRKRLLA